MDALADNKEYGQFLWPNGHRYYEPGGSPITFHRNRTNAHHGSEFAGWRLYLRSGEAKYWHFARAKSRQLLDNASINYNPWDPARDGQPTFFHPSPSHACHSERYGQCGG